MRGFWTGFWLFLIFLVVMVVAMRPDTVDGILLYVGTFLAVAGWALVSLVVILPVGAVVAGLLFVWMYIDKRRNESMRQRDGSFPLQKVNPKKPVVYYDPNQQVGSASAWVPGVGWVEYDGGAGWDNQRQIAAMRSYVSRVQAAAPGDAALTGVARELKDAPGAGGIFGRLRAGDARWAEKTPKGWGNEPRLTTEPARPAQTGPVAESAPAPLAPPLTLEEAASASRPSRIVFGWQPQTGEQAVWDLTETPHMRLHGGTQKGKTSAALTVVAGLLAQTAQVVVLDARGGKNWGVSAGEAEVADVRRPDVFLSALHCIHAEYVRRDAILAQEGAKDILALRGNVRLHRLAVVVEEYGAQRVRAEQAGTLAEVDRLMSILASEAAASGVHLIAVDTRPTDYDRFVKANLGAVVVFNLPDGAGKASGYAQAHKLPQYHFWFDGEIYRSVDSRDFVHVVPHLSPLRFPPLLAGVHGGVHGAVNTSSPEGETVADAVNTSMNTPANNAPATLDGWYEWVLDNYLPLHPELLQVDKRGYGLGIKELSEVMAEMSRGDAAQFEAMKGVASGVAKRLREEAGFAGGAGEVFGVDDTGGKKR